MIPKFFGQFLLERRIITSEELNKAIEYQSAQKQMLGELAIKEKLMTQKQVDEIRNLQKTRDKFFGELAVEKKYLTEESLKRLIILQKNSHIYLGDALIQIKVLSKDEVEKQLQNFKEDQKDTKEIVEVPVKHPLKEYFPYFIDLAIKLFRRIANIEVKLGEFQIQENITDSYYVSPCIEFSEDINLKFSLSLTEPVARKIASEFLEEEVEDEDVIIENAGEFLNVICGNISTKLQMAGIKTQISVPHISNKNTCLKMSSDEKALVFPLITANGICQAKIIVKDLDVDSHGKKNILIVDDSKSVAFKLTKIIERIIDFQVAGHAKNGAEALELYRKLKPDLVTMDIVLPDKTGIEVIKDIKKEFPDANIIVISSVGGGQDKLFEAIQAGAKNVIVKPFEEDAVREIFLQSV